MNKQTPQEVEESKLARAAEAQLTRLDEMIAAATSAAMKPWKTATRWLIGLVIAFALGTAVVGLLYSNQYSLTEQVRAQAQTLQKAAIAGCEAQNARSANDEGNWTFFLDILLKGNTNAYDLNEESIIKSHIATADAPRNCVKVYSVGR